MFMQEKKEKIKPEMKKNASLSGSAKGQLSSAGKNPRGLPGNIRAYTKGTEIHVAPGQEKHLPHEAWHVVQQMQGRVAPTGRIGGEAVNDSAALEREADVMGAKAVRAGAGH